MASSWKILVEGNRGMNTPLRNREHKKNILVEHGYNLLEGFPFVITLCLRFVFFNHFHSVFSRRHEQPKS